MLSRVDICPANGGILRFGDNVGGMWLIKSSNQLSYEGVHMVSSEYTVACNIPELYNKFCHNSMM